MKSFSKPCRLKGRKGYYVRIYNRATGRRSWLSTGCDDLKTARAWLDTQRMNEALGPERVEAQQSADMSFKGASTVWLATKEGNVGDARYRHYKGAVDVFWVPYFGKRTLRELSIDDVQLYFRKRRAGTLLGARKKPSASTVNTDLSALRSFFEFTVKRGWLTRNPAASVERAPGQIRRTIRIITPEHEETLVRACRESEVITVKARRNAGGARGGKTTLEKRTFTQTFPMPPYLAPLVRVALNCGFRRRTLCGLLWRHLDLKRREWRVPASLMKVPSEYTAPVPAVVIEELRDYRKMILESEGEARVEADQPIFGLLEDASVRKSLRRAARKSGLDGLTLHDLRRAYVNKLRRAGVGIEVAMRLSAHRNISTLVKFYREVDQDELTAAIRALDGMQRGKAKGPEIGSDPASDQAGSAPGAEE